MKARFSAPPIAVIALLAAWTGSAVAQCNSGTPVALGGFGPPSTTATEISTAQALELIRQRRVQLAQACPPGLVSINGICQPPPGVQPVAQTQPAPVVTAPAQPAVGGGAAVASGKASSAAAKAKAAPKAPSALPSKDPALVEQATYAPASAGRTVATWTEGFIDFEHHDDVVGGLDDSPTRRQRTVGSVSGIDWSQRSYGVRPEGVQFGLLGGMSETRNKFSDTTNSSATVATGATAPGGSVAAISTRSTTGAEQSIEGPFVGVYGSYFAGGFSADVLFKADFFDFDARGQTVETIVFANVCANPAVDRVVSVRNIDLRGDTSVHNYTLASNANYRMDTGGGYWWEPTAGIRFSYSDFGSDAALLGLADGQVLRLQGGVRVGHTALLTGGQVLTTALTGLLYSDVLVNGFVATSAGLPSGAAEVDEGKLRVMGVAQLRLERPDGISYYGQADIRGGEDVIGYGGKVGMRLEW
jgi:hypothetical protein